MNLATAFKWVIATQLAALLTQALLAGLALSGSATAISAHMAVAAACLVISVAQAALAFLWRRAGAPGWPLAISLLLLVAEIPQMASGRWQLFVFHLPLGVALFGSTVALATYVSAWRSGQIAVPSEARGENMPSLRGVHSV